MTHTVLDTAITWWDKNPDTEQREHKVAFRGDEVELPDTVVANFRAQEERYARPIIGSKEDYQDLVGRPGIPTAAVVSDEALLAMSGEELVATMNQNPGLAERIGALESSREGRPRRVVVDHANRTMRASRGDNVSALSESEDDV